MTVYSDQHDIGQSDRNKKVKGQQRCLGHNGGQTVIVSSGHTISHDALVADRQFLIFTKSKCFKQMAATGIALKHRNTELNAMT